MRISWQTALIAFIMAVSTWYLVTGREKIEIWMPMTIEMAALPDGYVIHKGMVKQVEVRVRGPKGMVTTLTDRKLSYPLDVSSLKVGENLIDIDKGLVPLSRAYEVAAINPDRLILTVDRETVKTVPVVVDWVGEKELHKDLQLNEIKVTPAFVDLLGPESELKKVEEAQVRMETVFDQDAPTDWSEDLPIVLSETIKAQPGLVRVDLRIGPKTQQITVKIRSIEADPPAGYTVDVTNALVTLEIEGPMALFRNDKFRDDIVVYPKIDQNIGAGKHELEYWVSLPEGCRLIEKGPATLTAVVRKQ